MKSIQCDSLEERMAGGRPMKGLVFNNLNFVEEEKMKKLLFLIALVSLCFAVSSPASAQYKAALGKGDVALKVDYFRFTDDNIDEDLANGVYIGLEAYMSVFTPNLYFGLESGWAGTTTEVDTGFGSFDVNIDYVPVEFNAKYVFDLTPCLALGLGGGLSMNYFNFNIDRDVDADDWLFGGQFFAELNYKIDNWFIGANLKYQLTDDITLHTGGISAETSTSADNFRAGIQAGFMF